MLEVILLILKIIGILLLAVLGLILLAIFIVLFTPIRYRVKLEHGEELLLFEGKLSWLIHIVRARVSHMDGVFHILVKVFWFTVYDNLQPRKHKPKKKTGNIGKQKKVTKAVKSEKDSRIGSREKVDLNNKNRKFLDITKEKQDTISEKTVSRVKETILVDKVEQEKEVTEKQFIDEKQILDKKQMLEESQILDEKQMLDDNQTISEEWEAKGKPEGKKYKVPLIKRIFIKIKELKEKIVTSIRNFIERIKTIFESIHNIKSKLGLIVDFIKEESNKEGFKLTFHSIRKIVKHILPKVLRSNLKFGTGDPCSTGQALGVLGVIYSFYGDKVQITPDFENKVLEGKHYARGRIRLVTILIIVIKLIIDKRFKQFTKNIVVLKEAL